MTKIAEPERTVDFVVRIKRPGKKAKWNEVDSAKTLPGAQDIYNSWLKSEEMAKGGFKMIQVIRRVTLKYDEVVRTGGVSL